mmetsp:Transcript_9423/g.22876  ORF Transcript_9423/g.22876 Transcript_9423/m.22876 type:complete len:922 (+) Transcript_9423:227-2992(+)
MVIPLISVLPPRLPIPQNDLAGMLASWMDNSQMLGLSSSSCREDLDTIGGLRREIARTLGEPSQSNDESAFDDRDDKIICMLQKYYHYLLECEEHGMVRQSSFNFIALEWESAVITVGPCKIQTSSSLESERANVIWNLASFEARKASKQDLETKTGWNLAAKCLQNAASWLRYLLALLQDQEQSQHDRQHPQYLDMSPAFVRFWQALLLAQAQHCIYESLARDQRRGHLLAAKVAAATVPLYNEVESIFQQEENSPDPGLPRSSDLVQTWANFAQAWGVYLACKTQYHQSRSDQEKKLWGQEIARLNVAYEHATYCKNICNIFISASSPLEQLQIVLDDTLTLLGDRILTAERENKEKYNQTIPEKHALIEIRGQKLAKCDEPLSALLPRKETDPIFRKKMNYSSHGGDVQIDNSGDVMNKPVTDKNNQPPTLYSSSLSPVMVQNQKTATKDVAVPDVQSYVELFKSEMNEVCSQISNEAESQTELARVALHKVNLPHSIIAYQQQHAGGGLPDDLWERVHKIQMEHQVAQLQQDLWELKDAADQARATHQRIKSQLDFDIKSDGAFRTKYPDFEGYDPSQVQEGFRQRLKTFHTLLSTAQEGDSKLFPRLEQLNVEPKYNLLQFPKSQLDRLLPAARESIDSTMIFDTHSLTYMWEELLDVFHQRDTLLKSIRDHTENYDILGALQSEVDPTTATDRDYIEVIKRSQQTIDGVRYKLRHNMMRQDELLNAILVENEAFMNARTRTANSQSADSCIVMIEDAIEEINQLSDHLKEGNRFYSVVIPKMEDLDRQVGDISARLAADRLEYEDKAQRNSQVLKDEQMAKSLFSNEESSHAGDISSPPSTSISPAASANASQWSSPNNGNVNEAQHASRDQTATTNVDDAKVRNLISMGFNPEKVVAALEKHDNNVDNAINELL